VQTPKKIHFHEKLPRSSVAKVLKKAVAIQAIATQNKQKEQQS